jgi:SAM-dependent methyltransferase
MHGRFQPLYVNYGCGSHAPKEWLNFDASPRLRLERVPVLGGVLAHTVGLVFPRHVRYGDIVAGLPLPADAATGVYCSRVLEHLPRDDIAQALTETLRILAPGGVFRLVAPDLAWRASEYLEAAKGADPTAADQFLDTCLLGVRNRPRGIMQRLRHSHSLNAHRWMYDYAAMSSLLDAAGFVAIRRCQFGDASDTFFAAVEDRSRFFDGQHPELAIEARKPG